MRKLVISEIEKKEILNLHNKKKKPFYLKEQDQDVEASDTVMKLIDAGFESAVKLTNYGKDQNLWVKRDVGLFLDGKIYETNVEVYLDDSLENLIKLVINNSPDTLKLEFEITNRLLDILINDERMRGFFAEYTGMMRMNADLYLDIYDDLEMNKQEDLNAEISVYLNLCPTNECWDRNRIGVNGLPILTNKKSSDIYRAIESKIDDENIKNKLSEMINICNIIQNKL